MDVDISGKSEATALEARALQFRALADPTRLRIFCFLRDCGQMVAMDDSGECRPVGGPGGATVGDVCCRFEQSQSTVSHHLRELRIAGLIHMQRNGRQVFCSVNDDALAELGGFFSSAGLSPGAGCADGSTGSRLSECAGSGIR